LIIGRVHVAFTLTANKTNRSNKSFAKGG